MLNLDETVSINITQVESSCLDPKVCPRTPASRLREISQHSQAGFHTQGEFHREEEQPRIKVKFWLPGLAFKLPQSETEVGHEGVCTDPSALRPLAHLHLPLPAQPHLGNVWTSKKFPVLISSTPFLISFTKS